MTDQRPAWGFSEMSEANFRRIFEFGYIEACRSGSTMTGVDTADYWLEVSNGKKKTRMPQGWNRAWEFVGLGHVPGLFGETYLGKRMAARLREIDAFEKKNAKDRAEFERLKSKFEGTKKEETDG